ncbi:OmpA family protein [Mariniflexile maritimum]|uniref:OmpA family protein n=1 Tax=Mariniflexile maritimum TaxID=2682493 RepID=UPI0012F63DB7|nr:OmpA family protein [Mariniflexile maritimum]
MAYRFCAVISFIIFHLTLTAQTKYNIVFPGNDRDVVCQQCTQTFAQKPKEVQFSVVRENDNLYFQVNDKAWFNQLFKNPTDGIAVDVVSKECYGCLEIRLGNPQIKGELLKPIYTTNLKSGLKPYANQLFRVFVGKIPNTLINKELEFNILFLTNNNLCRYNTIYHLESYPWDLLDMGMYLDSLTYNPKKVKPIMDEGFVMKYKTLKFKIPFKKNKSEYSQQDIKPIYDSLRLTDYNIKTIKIKAYSSVEGSVERNLELQQQRANSIVAALQSFQKPTIKTDVSSSENWVEFLNDIKGTPHDNLKNLTKKEIKVKLDANLSTALEPILKHHRKALLELELEKKDTYKNMPPDVLLAQFHTAITSQELEKAMEIQNSIFEKIKEKEITPDFLRKMEIPKQSKFVKIFNKNAAFRSMQDVRQSLIVYNELLELEKLAPNNGEVKYNIAAIKIILWRNKAVEVEPNKLISQINALKNYKIDASLIDRMLVNIHIIKAETLMQQRDYANKDKSVAFINSTYKNFPLSDYDYLSLAQFFSYYANTDLSVKLLENKAKSIDIDEDLLFYYLNLTLIDKQLTQDENYRTIMLNAININKARFCKLFNSIDRGGVTFQLLEDDYLSDTYCENCEN